MVKKRQLKAVKMKPVEGQGKEGSHRHVHVSTDPRLRCLDIDILEVEEAGVDLPRWKGSARPVSGSARTVEDSEKQ